MPASLDRTDGDWYWVPDRQAVWLPRRLCSRNGATHTFTTEDGHELELPAQELPKLQLVGADQLGGADDICSLDSVCEASVLHTLRVRYLQDKIYTWVSQAILIAMNPLRALPELYSDQLRASHAATDPSQVDTAGLSPHIFGVAQNTLMRLRLPSASDQAVLISGESGAGKTESAKHILSYVVGQAHGGSLGCIEQGILGASPVLEAFGNAATVVNGNSSRFGKWLDIRLSHPGGSLQVHGCNLTHYLLETARVCSQAPGERCYHVFYQLLAAPEAITKELGLEARPAAYNYLQGGLMAEQMTSAAIDDKYCFEQLQRAFMQVGIDAGVENEIFRTLAGILALGNCDFAHRTLEGGTDEASCLTRDVGARFSRQAADLLGFDREELADCMLCATRCVGGDVTRTPLRPDEARAVRDGLARLLYEHLFEWLLHHLNRRLVPSEASGGSQSMGRHSLGLLDIAGFENFTRNSLEQLLINLSNEYLQQSFNRSVFKAELDDCAREGIPAAGAFNFTDNLDCLELIDGTAGCTLQRAPGILDLLDEAVAMPKATDSSFIAKVLAQFAPKAQGSGHGRFIAPKFQGTNFSIRHFAGEVSYSCEGWLEKNANRPPARAMHLFQSSRLALVRQFGEDLACAQASAGSGRSSGRGGRARSASRPFRVSLRALMERMAASELHFVRCIKPRPRNQFDQSRFYAPKVAGQLCSGGILEAVRIRRSGFSSRWAFSEFAARFGCVAAASAEEASRCGSADAHGLVSALRQVPGLLPDPEDLVVGHTKVFAKAGAAAALEARRAGVLEAFARQMQCVARCMFARKQLAALQVLAPKEVTAPAPPHPEPSPAAGSGSSSSSSAGAASAAETAPAAVAAARGGGGGAAPAALQEESRPSTSSSDDARRHFASRRAIFERPAPKAVGPSGAARDAGPGAARAAVPAAVPRSEGASFWKAKDSQARQASARKALEDAVRKKDVAVLQASIAQGEAAGLAAPELSWARSVLRRETCGSSSSTAPSWRDKVRQRLEEATSSREVSALCFAIKKAEEAQFKEEDLRPARAALAEAKRSSAAEQLQMAIRARIPRALAKALEEAEAVGLDEELLSIARVAHREAQLRMAREEALEEAVRRVFRSATAQNIEALRAAIAVGEAAGFDDDTLQSARRSLREAGRHAALLQLREATRRHELASLQLAVDRGIAAGLEEQDMARALTLLEALTVLEQTIASRDVAALQTALAQGQEAGVDEAVLQRARRALAEEGKKRLQRAAAAAAAKAVRPDREGGLSCGICLEDNTETGSMPCCGRAGSSMRICPACLEQVTRCPFCRKAF